MSPLSNSAVLVSTMLHNMMHLAKAMWNFG